MNSKLLPWLRAAGLVSLLFCAAYVWPTIYRYDRVRNGLGASTVIRTNRLTSQIQTLSFEGWERPQTWRDRAIPLTRKD